MDFRQSAESLGWHRKVQRVAGWERFYANIQILSHRRKEMTEAADISGHIDNSAAGDSGNRNRLSSNLKSHLRLGRSSGKCASCSIRNAPAELPGIVTAGGINRLRAGGQFVLMPRRRLRLIP